MVLRSCIGIAEIILALFILNYTPPQQTISHFDTDTGAAGIVIFDTVVLLYSR